MRKKIEMSFNNLLTGCGCIPNFIQIDREICDKISADVYAFSYNCDIETGQDHSNWSNSIQFTVSPSLKDVCL